MRLDDRSRVATSLDRPVVRTNVASGIERPAYSADRAARPRREGAGPVRSHRIDAAGPSVRGGVHRPPVPRRGDVGGRHQHGRSSASIIELQRTAGNRVVHQVLLGGGPQAGPAPVVQRQKAPQGEYGLDTPASEDTYVAKAVTLWKTKRGMSVGDFAETMLRTIAVELKGYGVPLFRWKLTSGAGAAGIFDSKAWRVFVNVSKFSTRKVPKKLSDLNVGEVSEVVGTLYHEARHADQDVLIIRNLLAQRLTEAQIFAATGIHKDAIKAVAATTYADPLDPDEIAHTGRMFDVMYGAHKEFLTFLVKQSPAVEGLAKLAARSSKIQPAKAHIATFTTWQSRVLQPKVKAMEAATTLTPLETALLAGLKNVDNALTDLLASWAKVAGVKRPPATDVAELRERASDAHDEITAVYTSLEGEADAFRVEEDVKTAFTTKAAAP
jgi:hypothetical protein